MKQEGDGISAIERRKTALYAAVKAHPGNRPGCQGGPDGHNGEYDR